MSGRNIQVKIPDLWIAHARDLMLQAEMEPPRTRAEVVREMMRASLETYYSPDFVNLSPSEESLEFAQVGKEQTHIPTSLASRLQGGPVSQPKPKPETERAPTQRQSRVLLKLSAGENVGNAAERLWELIEGGHDQIENILSHESIKYPVIAAPFVIYDLRDQVSSETLTYAEKIFHTFWEETSQGNLTPHSQLPDRWNTLSSEKKLQEVWEAHFEES
jgi:hypothetical protein